MGRISPARRRRQHGVVLIWIALMGIVLIGFVGMACDIAFLYLSGEQLQNAADAASLAGVAFIRQEEDPATRQRAINIALENRAAGLQVVVLDNPDNLPEGDVVLGWWDRGLRTFTPRIVNPNAVKVVARRLEARPQGGVPLLFGKIFGMYTKDLERTAIAMIGGGTGGGLVCLDPNMQSSFYMHGTCTLDLNGGAIHVNSNFTGDLTKQKHAAYAKGDCYLRTPELNVYGSGLLEIEFDGYLNMGIDPIPDPLAWLPEPTWDPAADLGFVNPGPDEVLTIDPGYYSGGILMTNNTATLTLNPGVYILSGDGLTILGGNFYANGVMFYIWDNPDDTDAAEVTLGGNGVIQISSIDDDLSPYDGISFFQERGNTNTADITGGPNVDIEGTLYFRDAKMDVGGTSFQLGNQLVVGSAEIFGTGDILIAYDGRFPAPGGRVFLVE